MPIYDLNNRKHRIALAKEAKDPRVIAWIIKRHCGAAAVEEMREDWRKMAKEYLK